MRVRVLQSFVAMHEGQMHSPKKGSEIELPEGVDWIKAGFVEPIIPVAAPETSSIEPGENAAMPKARRRK